MFWDFSKKLAYMIDCKHVSKVTVKSENRMALSLDLGFKNEMV